MGPKIRMLFIPFGLVVILVVSGCTENTSRNGTDIDVLDESYVPGSPVINQLSATPTSISVGEDVTIAALVTDPDGLDDIAGGFLLDADNTELSYGPFMSMGGGMYVITLSWDDIDEVRPIVGAGLERTFVGEFTDLAGHTASAEVVVGLEAHGTLGQELFWFIQGEMWQSHTSAEKTAAFDLQETLFVASVEEIVPADRIAPLHQLLSNLLIDEGLFQSLKQKIATLMDVGREAPGLFAVWVDGQRRSTYVQQRYVSVGSEDVVVDVDCLTCELLAHLVNFPALPDLLQRLSRLVLEHDGIDDDPGSTPFMRDLLRAIYVDLSTIELDTDVERFSVLLTDFLLTEQNSFAPVEEVSPMYVVRLDRRGLPLVASTQDGTLLPPFVDYNEDGLADINDAGDFLNESGLPVDVAPFGQPDTVDGIFQRDSYGRVLAWDDQSLLYEYVDLHQTALGILLRQTAVWIDDDVLLNLMKTMGTVLGSRVEFTDDVGAFESYDRGNALVSLLFGLLVALDSGNLPEILEGLLTLLESQQNVVAELFYQVGVAETIAKRYPNAGLVEGSQFVDDLLPLLVELLGTENLLDDVIEAIHDPVLAELLPSVLSLMAHRNSHIMLDGQYDECFLACKARHPLGSVDRVGCIRACPRDMLGEDMVFNDPESEVNRSLWQRFIHLVHDTSDLRLEIAIERLEVKVLGIWIDLTGVAQDLGSILIFDDFASVYFDSVAGICDLEDYISPDLYEPGSFALLAQIMEAVGMDVQDATPVEAVQLFVQVFWGVTIDAHPTPDQLTRFLNEIEYRTETDTMIMWVTIPYCNQGEILPEHHADTLYAAEMTGLIDALAPLVRVLASHGKTDLLVDIISLMYEHYAGPDATYDDHVDETSRSNLRSLEPALVFSDNYFTPLTTIRIPHR